MYVPILDIRFNFSGEIQMSELIIDHVMQTLDNNCVSASLAMVTGYNIDEVTEVFHEKYVSQKTNPWDYLDLTGIKYRRCMAAERVLKPNCVYIMVVPSINISRGNHSIVVQMDEAGDNWWVLDPNNGKEGRKVYGVDLELVGWSLEFEFKVEDILEFQS